jgi:hypothetical protein
MRFMKAIIAVVLACAFVGCDQSPSAPSPTTVGLTLSQQTVAAVRNSTLALTVAAQSSAGSTADVTQSAIWSSSNEAVATVAAGMITVRGLGTAQITASYDGRIATAALVGRRRTHVDGRFVARDPEGEPTIGGLGVLLDEAVLINRGASGEWPEFSVTIRGAGPDKPIDPGVHSLSLRVGLERFSGSREMIALATTVTIYDSDTGEALTTYPLAQKRAASVNKAGFGESVMTWTIDVPAFTQ